MLALQADDAYECFFFIADWHMLTTHYDRTDELGGFVEDLALDWLAAGLDPERAVIYRQSDVPEVAEMALLLGMITPLGWLERVPSYKERLRDMAERETSNFGLLGYPVLQVVDISIVRAELVPVGEDQVAHLELSREIVRRFNRFYGEVLLEPQPLLSDSPLIPGSDGRKMSKSLDNTIGVREDEAAVRANRAIVHHRPPEAPQGRPRPPRDLPGLRAAPEVLARRRRPHRGDVPHGRARLRRLQDDPCRPSRRAVRPVPGTPSHAGSHAGSRPRGAGGRRRHRPADRAVHARDRPRRDASAMSSVDATSQGSAPTGFAVEVPGFEGPFRLLADLILDQKVDVCDVPIATVTEGFLRYAKESAIWNLEEATWFLAICAVLLELKVSRLTPKQTELDEEDLLGGSPDLAYARSIELRAFRKVALELTRRLEDEAGYFARDIGPGPEFAHLYPDPMTSVTGKELAALAAQLLRPPPAVDLSHVTPIRFTVTDAIEAVEAHLTRIEQGQATFRELTADCEDRMHVVVRFLALLELYRDGKVELQQAATFGEIEVAWKR